MTGNTGNTNMDSTLVEPMIKRRFTDAKKRQIIAECAAAVTDVERGVILRRWGTYEHTVESWSKEFSMTKPKTASRSEAALAKQLAAAEKKLAAAADRVELLEELVEAQGKVVGLHARKAGSPPRA